MVEFCRLEKFMDNSKNKKTVGVLLGLFLGLLGLLIGICFYPYNSEERKTFMSGWLIGFVISLLIGVIFIILYLVFFSNLIISLSNF